jgi:hypothetical protein
LRGKPKEITIEKFKKLIDIAERICSENIRAFEYAADLDAATFDRFVAFPDLAVELKISCERLKVEFDGKNVDSVKLLIAEIRGILDRLSETKTAKSYLN